MACKRVLARGYNVEVYDGTEYVPIEGINSISLTFDKETTDTTTFSSDGNAEHLATQRARTITAEGFEEYNEGTQDPGQAEVERLSAMTGCDAEATLHISHENNDREVWLNGTYNLQDIGGGTNDPSSWGFEFERSGATLEADPHATE